MISINREIKFWILVSLISLLLWTVYWTIPSSLERIVDLISGQPIPGESFGGVMYVWMEVSGAIGTTVRSLGVLFGIIVLYLLSFRNKSFLDVKKLVVGGLLIEAFYYFMVGFPSGVFMTTIGYGGEAVTLGMAYLLQFLFTTPFLVILSVKIYRKNENKKEIKFLKWIALAFVGYVITLWSNSVFRWFDMVGSEGLSFFSTGIRTIGALNAFVTMTLAVIFSIIGASYVLRGKKNPSFWVGLSVIMVGIHYLIYLVYSIYFGGMINSVMLVEVWAIPLLGLGVSIVRKK